MWSKLTLNIIKKGLTVRQGWSETKRENAWTNFNKMKYKNKKGFIIV